MSNAFDYRGPVRLEVKYKSGREEKLPFKNKRDATPTAKRLQALDTVLSVKMKKEN